MSRSISIMSALAVFLLFCSERTDAPQKKTPRFDASPPSSRKALLDRPIASLPRDLSAKGLFDMEDAPGIGRLVLKQAHALPLVSIPVKEVLETAEKLCTTLFYGVYIKGQKIGYARIGCRIERTGGTRVLSDNTYLFIKARLYSSVEKMEVFESSTYSISGRGELLRSESTTTTGKEKKGTSILRRKDGWLVTRTYKAMGRSKPAEKRIIKQIRSDLTNGEAALAVLLVRRRLKPSDRYRYLSFDHDRIEDNENAFQLLATKTRALQGVKTRLFKIEQLDLRSRFRGTAVMDENARYLRAMLPGDIEIRREEKHTAEKLVLSSMDFGLGTVIPARMDKVAPAMVRSMRIRLSGYLPVEVLTHPRHKVLEKGSGYVDLEVSREKLDGIPSVALPVEDTRFKPFLKATHKIEADHPLMRKLARKAKGNAKTAVEAARNITRFVYLYLRKSLTTNLDSALAIARARAGDCTEHALLMTALCRSVGLPSRQVSGVTYVPEIKGFGYHAWVEVWVGRWISADPSWNELPVNGTHIWMANEDDAEWMGTLGKLKAGVLGVEKD